MSDEREKKDDPTEELKQGLSHLWKAARSVGREVKKEVERTDFGKALDDAGREFVRAAANVVDRIAGEVGDLAKPRQPDERRTDAPAEPAPPNDDQGAASTAPPHDDDEFDGVKPKPKDKDKDPGAQDGGFRIAVDGDDKKKGS
jgi:hypothetical protein